MASMNRIPVFIVFAATILLMMSLLHSWSVETELRNKLIELSSQLKECSKRQASCLEESLSIGEQRDNYADKVNDLDKQKLNLNEEIAGYKIKISEAKSQINQTSFELQLCKTELGSVSSLGLTQKGMLETLRLEKSTLTAQLNESKKEKLELSKQIEQLKLAISKLSAASPMAKITPAGAPPKLSPVMNAPAIENVAKEDVEESNGINDIDNGFDPNLPKLND